MWSILRNAPTSTDHTRNEERGTRYEEKERSSLSLRERGRGEANFLNYLRDQVFMSDKSNTGATIAPSSTERAGVKPELNKNSKTITQDPTLPAAQAMLYGIGLTEDDLKKAQVGIVSTGYDGNTCNMHLNDLARDVKQSVWDNELVGLIFNTIGVSDGISNGTTGMRYSLVSREVIADSIEAVCGAQYYDGLIAVV